MKRKSQIVAGIDCHCSITGGVWISEDGKTAAANDYGKVGNILPVQTDATGPFIINTAGERIDTGYAVCEAWNYMAPSDGPRKAIRIDGNPMNTSASNLQWRPDLASYTQSTTFVKRVDWMNQSVMVCSDGRVMSNSLELEVHYYYHDDATDCDRFLYKPFVMVGKVQLPIDDLMAAAGFVGGNPAGMKCPKVVHKDYDIGNFKSDNLVWGEFMGAEYQNYVSAMIITNQQKSNVQNAGKSVPAKWFNRPYYPWAQLSGKPKTINKKP